ncbi:TPA: transcriptional regulator [Vibrio vulnificus]
MDIVNFEAVSIRISNTGSTVEFLDGQKFKITTPESRVLKCLLENKGNLVTYEELENAGWQGDLVTRNSLAVAIYNLRKITSSSPITISNELRLGYKLVVNEEISKNKNEFAASNDVDKSKKLMRKKHNYEVIVLALVSLIVILSYFYVSFSWVQLECERVDDLEICYFEGNKPKDTPGGSTGMFYFVNDRYLEVHVD